MSIRKLNDALQQKAIRELNEDPNRIQEDINYIKEWLQTQPHLNARTDDQFILSFLRGSKFSLQDTQKKLDIYYTIRTEFAQYLTNRDPFIPEIQELLDLGVILPLPKTVGDDGPRIILMRYGDVQSKLPRFVKNSFVEAAIMIGSMFLDILFNEDDNFIVGGQQGITDTKGAGPEHVIPLLPKLMMLAQEIIEARELEKTAEALGKRVEEVKENDVSEIQMDEKTTTSIVQATKTADELIGDKLSAKEKQQLLLQGVKFAPKVLPLLRKAEIILNEGLPARAQRWDFINPPQMWQMPYQVVKPYLPEKYMKKIFIHDNEEELYKIVPRSILPKEYGGEAGTIDEIKDYWKKKIESYKDWFLEDEQYRCDESKRPPKFESNIVEDGTFGTEGTFRNLRVE